MKASWRPIVVTASILLATSPSGDGQTVSAASSAKPYELLVKRMGLAIMQQKKPANESARLKNEGHHDHPGDVAFLCRFEIANAGLNVRGGIWTCRLRPFAVNRGYPCSRKMSSTRSPIVRQP